MERDVFWPNLYLNKNIFSRKGRDVESSPVQNPLETGTHRGGVVEALCSGQLLDSRQRLQPNLALHQAPGPWEVGISYCPLYNR